LFQFLEKNSVSLFILSLFPFRIDLVIIFEKFIKPGTLVNTDEYDIYCRLTEWGYAPPGDFAGTPARQRGNSFLRSLVEALVNINPVSE